MATASLKKTVGDYEIDIDPENSLGAGSFGSVFVGRHAKSKKEIAAKLIEWDFVTDEMDREANLMKSISDHPNILKIMDYIKKGGKKKKVFQAWIILELCTLGNVEEYAEKKALSIVQKVDLIVQGSLGLQHLHRQKPSIIHHDVKLKNLLVTGSKDDPVVKVGDFGISKVFAHTQEQSVTKKTREGTEFYWAPELYRLGEDNKPKYNKAVDVFAMAISALTLVEEQHGKRISTYTVKVGGNRRGLGEHIYEKNITNVAALIMKYEDSEEAKKFKTIIASMLAPNAKIRLTIHGVVDRLTQLRSELGVLTFDTVWTPAKFNVSRQCLRTAASRAKMREMMKNLTRMLQEEEGEVNEAEKEVEEDVEVKEEVDEFELDEVVEEEDLEETSGTLRNKERILTDELWKGPPKFYMKATPRNDEGGQQLMVMEQHGHGNKLWIHNGTKWISSYVREECNRPDISVGYVSDGLVATGVQICYHFSLIRRDWRKLKGMMKPRSESSTAEIMDMMLMVIGGWSDMVTPSTVCEVLDVIRGEWSLVSPLPNEMSGEVVAAAVKDRAYTLGHTTRSDLRFLEYDPQSNAHTKKPSPPVKMNHQFSIRSIGGLAGVARKIYLFCKDARGQNQALQYDPVAEQWSELAPPTTIFTQWTSDRTIVKDGRILLCGTSRSTKGDGNLIEEYNIETKTWKILDIRLPF